jgi:hypothetical protein
MVSSLGEWSRSQYFQYGRQRQFLSFRPSKALNCSRVTCAGQEDRHGSNEWSGSGSWVYRKHPLKAAG